MAFNVPGTDVILPGNPYILIGTQIGKLFGFDPIGDITGKLFGGLFGGKDRGIVLQGVKTGDTSKFPPIIKQQLGYIPQQTFTPSKYRHTGGPLNKQLQEMDRVFSRTISRANAIADIIPEFAPLRDQLVRDRNAFIKPNTSGGYAGGPPGFSNALQKAFQDTVSGEAIIDMFSKEVIKDPEFGADFESRYGTTPDNFFKELNRRSQFDIAREQVDMLRPVAGDPNNPQSGKAKQDLGRMFEKMKSLSEPVFDLQSIMPNARPSSAFVYNETAGQGGGQKGLNINLPQFGSLINQGLQFAGGLGMTQQSSPPVQEMFGRPAYSGGTISVEPEEMNRGLVQFPLFDKAGIL